MTKAQIIKELEELNVEIDENDSKEELAALLESAKTKKAEFDGEVKEPVEELPKKDNNESKYGVGKVFTPANL